MYYVRAGWLLFLEDNPRNRLTVRVVQSCPLDKDAVLMRSEVTEGLFRDAGFSRVYSRFIISIPPFPLLLTRHRQAPLGGFPFGARYYVAATS